MLARGRRDGGKESPHPAPLEFKLFELFEFFPPCQTSIGSASKAPDTLIRLACATQLISRFVASGESAAKMLASACRMSRVVQLEPGTELALPRIGGHVIGFRRRLSRRHHLVSSRGPARCTRV